MHMVLQLKMLRQFRKSYSIEIIDPFCLKPRSTLILIAFSKCRVRRSQLQIENQRQWAEIKAFCQTRNGMCSLKYGEEMSQQVKICIN